MSKKLGELVVRKCEPEEFKDCDIVFSGLDSDVASEIGGQDPNASGTTVYTDVV